MGNCSGRPKSSKYKETQGAHHDQDRKRVYDAQDSFVRGLIEHPDGNGSDGDADSVGPGKY